MEIKLILSIVSEIIYKTETILFDDNVKSESNGRYMSLRFIDIRN